MGGDSVVVTTLEHLDALLDQLAPSFLVLMDPDLAATRQAEVYHAHHPKVPFRVYSLTYEKSVEAQRLATDVLREGNAFESLIENKSTMVVPATQDGKSGDDIIKVAPDAPAPASTRRGGGAPKRRVRVIIDAREFRSALPSMLHLRGAELVPRTLEVGDYILSPQMCVERKSLSDLFSSFASGRLYQQVEAMTRFYKQAVLLIEFDENRPFQLQAANQLGLDISAGSITSKLTLLTIHFPSLRIMWMRSPHNTAEMFDHIKQNQEEPVADDAERVGLDDSQAQSSFNIVPQDVLRRLPGINPHNVNFVMNHVESLSELSRLSMCRLKALLGDQNAKQLHDFLHAKPPSSIAKADEAS